MFVPERYCKEIQKSAVVPITFHMAPGAAKKWCALCT